MSSSTRRPHRVSIKRQMLLIASVPVFVATSLMVLMSYHNNIRHNREQMERQGQFLAACGLARITRASARYTSHKDPQNALRMRLKELAAIRVGFVFERLTILLRREGWMVGNH